MAPVAVAGCPVPAQSPHVPAHHTRDHQHDCPVKASHVGLQHSRHVISHTELKKKPAPCRCNYRSSNNNNSSSSSSSSSNNNDDDDDVSQQEGPSCSVGMTCLRERKP